MFGNLTIVGCVDLGGGSVYCPVHCPAGDDSDDDIYGCHDSESHMTLYRQIENGFEDYGAYCETCSAEVVEPYVTECECKDESHFILASPYVHLFRANLMGTSYVDGREICEDCRLDCY